MSAENPLVSQERAMGKCPLLYAPLGDRLVGREPDLERLDEQLVRKRLVVLRGVDVGVGATALAVELAHRRAHDYPGGTLWVPYHVSNQKGLAADIIEALDLPCPVSQRYPFIGTAGALGTMWRGLADRARTLIVVDGWTSSDGTETWRSPTDNVHVLGIARPDDSVSEDCLFALGPPDLAASEKALGRFNARAMATAVATSGLTLSIALRLLAQGRPLSCVTDPETMMREAVDSLPSDARRLLGVLCLLNDQPVPTALLDAIYLRLGGPGSADPWRGVLASLVERSLATSTIFGEPRVHERLLAQLSPHVTGDLDPLRGPVFEGLLEALRDTSSEAFHSARRLVPHTYAVLTSNFEGQVSSALFAELVDVVGEGSSHPLAVIAAQKGVARAQADGDLPRVVRHQVALGHAFSELRQLDDAQVALRAALTTAERAHGPESLEVAGVLDRLDRAIGLGVCGDAGPEELAIATRAHEIRECTWGGEDPRLRGSLEHLALKLAVRDRHADALALYQRALRLAEPCSPNDVHLLHSVGMALAGTGRIDEALSTIERLLDLEATIGFDTGLITLMFAEEVLQKANRNDRFIDYVDRVLRETEWKKDDEAQADRGKVLAMRARALVSAGRAAEAAGVAVEAIAVLERYYGGGLRSMPALREIALSGASRPTS